MINWEKRKQFEEKAKKLVEKLGLKNFDDYSVSYQMEKIDEWNEKLAKGEVKGQKKTFSEKKLIQADEWITERDERAAKFFEELKDPKKLEPMFDYIRKLIGMPDLKFTVEVNTYHNQDYIEFKSEDIHDNFLIRNAWEEFKVSNFNSNLFKQKYEDGFDRYDSKETDLSKPAKVQYWWSIHFSYRHWGGGTNGAEIASAWVDDKFNWTFKSEKERHEELEANREEQLRRLEASETARKTAQSVSA